MHSTTTAITSVTLWTFALGWIIIKARFSSFGVARVTSGFVSPRAVQANVWRSFFNRESLGNTHESNFTPQCSPHALLLLVIMIFKVNLGLKMCHQIISINLVVYYSFRNNFNSKKHFNSYRIVLLFIFYTYEFKFNELSIPMWFSSFESDDAILIFSSIIHTQNRFLEIFLSIKLKSLSQILGCWFKKIYMVDCSSTFISK